MAGDTDLTLEGRPHLLQMTLHLDLRKIPGSSGQKSVAAGAKAPTTVYGHLREFP